MARRLIVCTDWGQSADTGSVVPCAGFNEEYDEAQNAVAAVHEKVCPRCWVLVP